MTKQPLPYVTQCQFCGDGLLRFMQCDNCQSAAAVCDECELVWEDIAAVSASPRCQASTAFPHCPHCQEPKATWSTLDGEAVEAATLSNYIGGISR